MATANEAHLKILDEDALLTCCFCEGLLEDPQQLECLHNCCRRCVGHIMSPADERLVTCPECRYVSDSGRMTGCSFIQKLVRRRKAFAASIACASCEDKSDVTSMCAQCREFLCNDCSQVTLTSGHQRLDTMQLHDAEALRDMTAGRSLKGASDEARPGEVGGFSCHSVSPNSTELFQSRPCIGSTVGSIFGGKMMASAAGLEAAYLRTYGAFSKRRGLIQELQAARVQQRKVLQERKLKLLDAVDNVYSEAERKLDDIFDVLEAKADKLTAKTERLERASSYAVSYCRIAASADDYPNTKQSNQHLQKCIERLTKEVEAVCMPIEVGTLVSAVHLIPETLKETLATWIGIPKMTTDKLEPEEYDEVSAVQGTAVHRPLKHSIFSQSSRSVELAVDCYDISIAYDGRLLLAARERGLLECRASGGELVTSYVPPLRPYSGKVDWVTAVDSTCDRRVAAGVYWQRMVVILADGSVGWREVQCITDVLLTEQLSHLSIYTDVVAVTGCVSDGCRSALSISSLSCGRVLHHQRREYIVRSVAVISTSVITASRSLVKLSDSSGRSANLVDAYNYRGDVHLWRYVLAEGETAMDVALNLFDHTLYIAIESCNSSVQRRIVAVRGEDGCEIETSMGGGVVVDGRMLEDVHIYRVALAASEEETCLAALSYYTATVTLYAAATDDSSFERTGRRRLEDVLQSLKLQKWQPGKTSKTFLKQQKYEKKNLENRSPMHDKDGNM